MVTPRPIYSPETLWECERFKLVWLRPYSLFHIPPLLLWAPRLCPGVAGTAIPGGQWGAANTCHPGQTSTGIHVIPLASAREHTEDKAMLVFVLQWAKDGETPKGCLE